MNNWFRQFSVATRLRALAWMTVIGIVCVACGLLWSGYQQQMGDRQGAVKQAVELAWSVVQHAHAQQLSGALSQTQAQQLALATLDRLRYGGNEYFWVNDMSPRMVHHPIKPQLDGRDVSGMKDPQGVALFQAFVAAVRSQGEGFVHYQWPKPGMDVPQDKVSYVKGFAPWGWVIGSGLYVDDVQAAFKLRMLKTLGLAATVALLLALAMEGTARDLSAGVQAAVARAEAIAGGDIATGKAPHALAQGRDEVARLLKAMQRMSEGLGDTVGEVRRSVSTAWPWPASRLPRATLT
jgi:methyl-accepting chemotaxis protein